MINKKFAAFFNKMKEFYGSVNIDYTISYQLIYMYFKNDSYSLYNYDLYELSELL